MKEYKIVAEIQEISLGDDTLRVKWFRRGLPGGVAWAGSDPSLPLSYLSWQLLGYLCCRSVSMHLDLPLTGNEILHVSPCLRNDARSPQTFLRIYSGHNPLSSSFLFPYQILATYSLLSVVSSCVRSHMRCLESSLRHTLLGNSSYYPHFTEMRSENWAQRA